jgi:hypothetical protein
MKPKFRIRKLYELSSPDWHLLADVDYWDYIVANINGIFGVKEMK